MAMTVTCFDIQARAESIPHGPFRNESTRVLRLLQ